MLLAPLSGVAVRYGVVPTAAAACLIALSVSPASAAEVPTPWRFGGIGPSQTLIRVVAQGGRCDVPGAPRVEETATTVRITTIRVRPDQQEFPCPAIIDFDDVYVPLSSPLAGRKLLGASASPNLMTVTTTPPRVVGLAPGDAITVLSKTRNASGTLAKPIVVRRSGGTGLRRVVSQKGLRVVIAGGPSAH